MIRVEVYGNVELMEDFKGRMEKELPEQFYSMAPQTHGYGKKGYAFGDVVWPETNFVCVCMISEDEASVRLRNRQPRDIVRIIKEMCSAIQKLAPENSLTLFAYRVESVL